MKIAVIGAGWAGKVHIDGYKSIKDISVLAVADENKQALDWVKNKHSDIAVTTCVDELITNDEIEAISICTPPSTHCGLACAALLQGKHVCIEKPMAMTAQECEQIIAAGRKSSRVVQVCHNKLMSPWMTKLKTHMATGDNLRSLLLTHISPPRHSTHWTTTAEEGGMLWEELSHHAYIICSFADCDNLELDVTRSSCFFKTTDNIVVAAKNPKGAIFVSRILWHKERGSFVDNAVAVMESGRVIEGDLSYLPDRKCDVYKDGLKKAGLSILQELLARACKKRNKAEIKSYHTEVISDFINNIKKGLEPTMGGIQGLASVRFLENVIKI